MKRLLPVVVIVALAAAGAGIYRYWDKVVPPPAERFFQGYVDGDLIHVGPQLAGRLVQLDVREGDAVRIGQELFALDDSVLQADLELAAARLEQARASLRLAEAQRRRPEEIKALEAAVDEARAALAVSRAEYERMRRLFARKVVSRARLDAARGAWQRDKARFDQALRQLQSARLPARAEQINAAMAQVRAAQAQVRAARVRLLRAKVLSPVAGRVQEVHFRPGEIVAAGRPVVTVLPPAMLKIRFYVPERQRARHAIGDKVRIRCDGCGRDFFARISYISGQAEYTPPVIFSPRERARLVYRFEARPAGKDGMGRLAIGQPVDVFTIPGDRGK